jgi:Ig-like domain from next to BRCA1 gene
MNHVKRVLLGSILLWAILLSACSFSSTNSANTLSAIYTAAAQTIVAQQPTVEQTDTPMPTDTASMLTPTDSGSTTPTVLPTLVSSLPTSATSGSTCNSSYVADATIPDGTVMSPGQTFVKTWTLQNTGSCTWDTSFTMRFFSGSSMSGGNGTVSSSVAPGGQGNVSVTLTAPTTAGTYTGNWRLADDSGITFGEIVDVVIDVNGNAPTETPAATATNTPGTYTPAPTATNTPVTPAVATATTASPPTATTAPPPTATTAPPPTATKAPPPTATTAVVATPTK